MCVRSVMLSSMPLRSVQTPRDTLPFAVTVLHRRKPTMAYDRSGRGTARKSYSRR